MVARYCRRFVEQTLVPDDGEEDPGPMPVEDSNRPNSPASRAHSTASRAHSPASRAHSPASRARSPAARSKSSRGDSKERKIHPYRALGAFV